MNAKWGSHIFLNHSFSSPNYCTYLEWYPLYGVWDSRSNITHSEHETQIKSL